jgi:hypothetical protein
VLAYGKGTLGLQHDTQGRLAPGSLVALLKAAPRTDVVPHALELRHAGRYTAGKQGLTVSAETLQHWLHAIGWRWKLAKLVAKDHDPHRVERLARIRLVYEPWRLWEALVFAAELDSRWLPKAGYAWTPQGIQEAAMSPWTHEQP